MMNMNTKLNLMTKMAGALVMGLLLGRAHAVDVSTVPNEVELTRLPPYCAARYKSPQPLEWTSWRNRIGENFNDLHHYCSGLNFLNRYWAARTQQERRFYLERALSGMNYLVENEKPDFSLKGELYTNRGEVYKLMGKPGEAARDFNHAIQVEPKFVRSYLLLADLNVAEKNPSRALEVITAGLRNNPDSKALQRHYLELGGKKPFPEPAKPEPAKENAEAQAADKAKSTPTSGPSSPPASTSAEPAPAAPAPIGTPSNPYCRFCP
jgi:tetratricopeptide (TPR) repeat protein